MQTILFLSGLFAFLGASAAAFTGVTAFKRNHRQVILWLCFAGALLFLSFAVLTFISRHAFTINLYNLLPDLQFTFTVDRLSAFFISIISLVSISVTLYSMRYTELHGTDATRNLHIGLMSLFVLSMILVVSAANTFCLLFAWEIMSITSFFLVMQDRDKKETQKSGLFYFVMTQMSTVFLMAGFLVLYRVTGSFDIQPAAGLSAGWNTLVFLTIFIGFSIKAGVMPFHKWLPYAHSASPSNISALMSGVMIKVAIYGIVRFVVFVLSPDNWWGILIFVFGIISALLGVIYALKEHDIKKLLAYHSIENIGIILIGIGLYLIFQANNLPDLAALSLLGGLFHTLNHALFKSLLFLTGGAVVEETRTRNIEAMGGLIKRMPYTGILFLIGAIAISALPPFNGFVSELMIFQSFLQSFIINSPFLKLISFAGLSLFALTSALAAACFVKAFGIIFLAVPRSEEARKAREVSLPMIAGPAVLAVLCAGLGIFSYQIFEALGFKLPIPNLMVVGLILIISLIVIWVVFRLSANRKVRVSETWGCGLTAQDSRMEYTASGFSEPILNIFRPIYRTRKVVKREFNDSQGSIFKHGTAEIHTFKFFEERLYLPVAHFVRKLSLFVSNLHDVDLDTYILYSFIAIVILIIAMVWVV